MYIRCFQITLKQIFHGMIADMPESVKVTEWDDERIKKWASKLALTLRKVIDNIFLTSVVKEQDIILAQCTASK